MARIQEIYIHSYLFGTLRPPLPVANAQQFPLSSFCLSHLQTFWDSAGILHCDCRVSVRMELEFRISFRTVDMIAIK